MVETVLLIDDDKATQYVHKRIITKHNKFKNILTFLSGSIALDYLKSINVNFTKKPQLIFLDLNMPGMNGWEFIEQYNGLCNSITRGNKLIILSTSNDPIDISRSREIDNVNDFISKPLSIAILDKVLETHFVDI
ncbi:response regulator [Aquimarina sp. AD10]|uniref:response regulator n=2 Tax=Aquimarina sp. AD10 TaxID=1714849 RepID=UPI000E47DE6F|nr:response regulator [Aquimarina sp. AD10]AXT61054.1 response regulator [Aquimarina sp. AD10]